MLPCTVSATQRARARSRDRGFRDGEPKPLRITGMQANQRRGFGVSVRVTVAAALGLGLVTDLPANAQFWGGWGNSKIPYTLTLYLPFPVVRNQDLDHTIKPCHWSRPFTPHFRPSDGGKFLVERSIAFDHRNGHFRLEMPVCGSGAAV
jgi:hypothetical protein